MLSDSSGPGLLPWVSWDLYFPPQVSTCGSSTPLWSLFLHLWLAPLGAALPCTWPQKWRRFAAVLYRQSGCALARLELQESPEKLRRGEAARRVIRLSDCLRVTEANGEASSPRDTSAFLLETKDRLYLLATPTAERSHWMQAICLLAFPVSVQGCREGKG